MTIRLAEYAARVTPNRQFEGRGLASLDRFFLPPSQSGLLDEAPLAERLFLEDDNRGAVSPESVAVLDGTPYYLSVKGVGSTVDPFANRPFDRGAVERLTDDPETRRRLRSPSVPHPEEEAERYITGETWLRGSPYGGQGWEHARIALTVSERADLTSLQGFRIAPVVQVAHLPPALEERIRSIHWYHRFRGPIVQEIRLVPSNVRIYFHARSTLGTGARELFDRFGVRSADDAVRFEIAFLRSAIPLLTLFPRTLRLEPDDGRYYGLDFHDVWLDKDAVLAPDGTVHFVDLEGIEEEGVERAKVREKIEDQVYRSLYEVLFAYEQIDQERARRFGDTVARKTQFVRLLERALAEDRWARLATRSGRSELAIGNALSDAGLNTAFPLVDLDRDRL